MERYPRRARDQRTHLPREHVRGVPSYAVHVPLLARERALPPHQGSYHPLSAGGRIPISRVEHYRSRTWLQRAGVLGAG